MQEAAEVLIDNFGDEIKSKYISKDKCLSAATGAEQRTRYKRNSTENEQMREF